MREILERRIKILEKKVKTLEHHIRRYEPRFSLGDYMEKHNLYVEDDKEATVNLRIQMLTKERGYRPHNDTFPQSVLDEVFEISSGVTA